VERRNALLDVSGLVKLNLQLKLFSKTDILERVDLGVPLSGLSRLDLQAGSRALLRQAVPNAGLSEASEEFLDSGT
jgi:hypothetical protein